MNPVFEPGAPERRSLPRSIWAVAAGVLTIFILSIAVDVVLHSTGIFPPMGQPMDTVLWGVTTAYRLVFQIGGAWLTARLAPSRPMRHAMVLAGIGLVLSMLGLVLTWDRGPEFGPKWYPIGLVLSAVPCCWAGAWLHARRAAKFAA